MTHLNTEDRRALALVAVWIAGATVGAVSLGLALGLAIRAFTFASGL